MKSSISYTIKTSNYLNEKFSQEFLSNLNSSLIDDFNKKLPSKIVGADGGRLKLSLFPFFLKKADKEHIERVCLSIHKIVKNIIDLFLKRKDFVFDFYKEYDYFSTWIFKQKNYYQAISRYDFMINNNEILFYEFNGCLPGGFFVYDRMNKVVLNYISRILDRAVRTTFKPENFFYLVSSLLNVHSLKSSGVALLYDDYGFDHEFEIIKEELELREVSVEVSHIKNIKYLFDKLVINEKECCIAYNNFFLADSQLNLAKEKWIYSLGSKPYKELITLAKNGNVSLIHSLGQMTIGEDKSIFALLSDPRLEKYFNSEEIELISKHIPYTKRLVDLEHQDKIKAIQDKDRYILKRYYSQLGAGVYKGHNYSESEWINLLDRCHDQAVLQKKIDSLKYSYFDPTNNSYRCIETNLSMSMYVINGQCSGLVAHLLPLHSIQSILQPVFECHH